MDARPEDLHWFAENLEIGQFTALSQGIGVGDLVPKKSQVVRPATTTKISTQQNRVFSQSLPTSYQNDKMKTSLNTKPMIQNKRPLINWRRFEAVMVDILLLATAVAVSIACAALVATLKNGVNSDGWINLSVLKWVRELTVIQLSTMGASLLLGYFLLFKIAMGQTPGENFSGCLKNHKDFIGYEKKVPKGSL